ncbi:hypothetical protein [Vibrio sp. V04_P4A5T148]|uniref:hypothetical protein n=1 Tax=Vibrio sp. V04_P4A5T148 TaxID=1938659 RepID=UPI000B8EB9D5|nr:hypothetical protein [Vibrio sp. V04_P4A5T148]OXX34120.1 hypothetical protein B9J81_09535 [Vibrio sp. V04_P4A5T148]
MLDTKYGHIIKLISLIIFSNIVDASVYDISIHSGFSRNDIVSRYGIGSKYDFDTFSAEGTLYTNNENDMELSSYLRYEYDLDPEFSLVYGLGYYKDDNKSGIQSKLELGYKINNNLQWFSYISLHEGNEARSLNTWFGLGLR